MRITVDVTQEVYDFIKTRKDQKGSSISFEANILIEYTIREIKRKKKLPLHNGSKEDNP
jgi:hypothetical protein